MTLDPTTEAALRQRWIDDPQGMQAEIDQSREILDYIESLKPST